MEAETPTISSDVVESLDCLNFGSCIDRNYEYIMYLNGQEIKVEYCFSNYYGDSYCVLNGQTYQNVQYTSRLISEEKVKSDIYLFHPIVLSILVFIIGCYIIKHLLKDSDVK